jgi:hypothetical protein
VYERVTKEFSDLLGEELDPAYLYLHHGTTIEKATAIVKNGPDIRLGADATDFGKAFYLTDYYKYALFAGHQVSGGRRQHHSACLSNSSR